MAICLASDDGRRVGHAVDKTMMRCGTGWPGRGGGVYEVVVIIHLRLVEVQEGEV